MNKLTSLLLALICALPLALAGEEELSFTPERMSISRSGETSYQASVQGRITLPAGGLLFQPLPYASEISVQDKDIGSCFIYYATPPARFVTQAQPLVQSSAANGCAIAAKLWTFWPHHKEVAEFNLGIELTDIPSRGEIKLQEKVPFLLAQDVFYGEQIELKAEQIKAIPCDEELDGEIYHIKLGIKAEEDIYCYQFFTAHGEEVRVHIREMRTNA